MAKDRSKKKKVARSAQVNELLRVLVDKKPYAALLAHASTSIDAEVGGILLGKTGQNRQGAFVHIIHCIQAKYALERATGFTFTHESWNAIHAEKEANYPDLEIVGWYHTHPGYGVELSDQDRFIHSSFFSAPYQVAYVYDPLSGAEAFYVHPDGTLRQVGHYWLGDRLRQPIHHSMTIETSQPPSFPIIQVKMPAWGWGIIGILAVVIFGLGAWIYSLASARPPDGYPPAYSLLALAASSTPTRIFLSATAPPTLTLTPTPIQPTPILSNIPAFTPTLHRASPTILPATSTPGSIGADTALPSARPPVTPTARMVWQVQPGESLGEVAWRFCVSRVALEQANGLAPGNQVRVGDWLTIPEPQRAPIVYIVQPGDTLSALAIRFCVSVQEITEVNGITNPRRLLPDQKLTIPNAVLR
jgi:proteasome lid subunit RPN8/RPN11/LysM repeat protein